MVVDEELKNPMRSHHDLEKENARYVRKAIKVLQEDMVIKWLFHTFSFLEQLLMAFWSLICDSLTCSIMKHCQDAQQRMAMWLIYLHVSWIRQDCMRSRVSPM